MTRLRLVALAAVAAAAFAVATVAAGVAFAATPARAPFAIAVGDTVRVSGTQLSCTATGQPGAAGLLCSLRGKDGKEAAGTYGVALSDHGEALVIEFAEGGAAVSPKQLWRVKAGHRAASAAGAAPVTHVTDVGGSWFLAGTDLRCVVKRGALQPGVVCSRYDAQGVRPNSNSIAITPAAAGIYRYDGKRRAARTLEKAEPDRVTTVHRTTTLHRTAARPRAAAATRPTPIVQLAVRDTLRLPSSRVACTVTSDGTTPAMFCVLVARQTTPVPKSYAVGLDGNGAAILVSYDATSRGSLLRTIQAGGRTRAPRATGRVVTARFGEVYRVTGTVIVCNVLAAGAPGVACTLNGPKGRIIGAPGIAVTDGGSARIFRVTSKTAFTTVIERAQPASR